MKRNCKTKLIKHLPLAKLTVLLFLLSTSCKKFVDVQPPPTKLTQENVYGTDATATALLTGLYSTMADFTLAVSVRPSLSADELRYYPATAREDYADYYVNGLNPLTSNADLWELGYKFINVSNTALEGLGTATALTPAVKQQLTGEALFMRAYLHFTLSNLYGDIPLVTSSDYRTNSVIARSPRQAVLAQVIADLKSAQTLLSTDYRDGNVLKTSTERVRPNQAAATALLARAYLYNKEWAAAETEATKVLGHTDQYMLVGLNDVFLANNQEAIWQLASSDPFLNTRDGQTFILEAAPDYDHPVTVSESLLNSFEAGDQRKVNWIGHLEADNVDYYFPYKYKISGGERGKENVTLLRLGEQFLIRAEARAQLAKFSDARNDLNAVRRRAGLLPVAENDQQALLELIYHERRVELFTESGHRWNDLKRTNTVDDVMQTATQSKGGVWKTTAQLYPISQRELDVDHNLTQNPGY